MPLIVVMQATEDRVSDDLALVLLLFRQLWRAGEALVPALVRSGLVEIGLILLHDLAQMVVLAENSHPFENLSYQDEIILSGDSG